MEMISVGLFLQNNQKTKLQVNDRLEFDVHSRALLVSRDGEPLVFQDDSGEDEKDQEMSLLFLKKEHYIDEMLEVLSAFTGLRFVELDARENANVRTFFARL